MSNYTTLGARTAAQILAIQCERIPRIDVDYATQTAPPESYTPVPDTASESRLTWDPRQAFNNLTRVLGVLMRG